MNSTEALADRQWGELLMQSRERLERMIRVRMDARLRNRLDPADVLQDCFLDATRRRAEFQRQSDMPLIVWLRLLALQKLAELHRRHLRTKARSAYREVMPVGGAATSAVLAAQLLGELTTPSQVVARDELEQRLIEAIDGLDPIDQECIVLRNFERLTNVEAAEVLGLSVSAASSRYIRALQKLRSMLKSIDGLSSSQWLATR